MIPWEDNGQTRPEQPSCGSVLRTRPLSPCTHCISHTSSFTENRSLSLHQNQTNPVQNVISSADLEAMYGLQQLQFDLGSKRKYITYAFINLSPKRGEWIGERVLFTEAKVQFSCENQPMTLCLLYLLYSTFSPLRNSKQYTENSRRSPWPALSKSETCFLSAGWSLQLSSHSALRFDI